MDRKPFDKRFEAMVKEANTWTPTWKELCLWENPTRGSFDDLPNQGKKIDHKNIIDNTARLDIRIGAAGMTSGLTSPSRPWFKLGLGDESLMQIESVKTWLYEVEQKMMFVFSKSNIYEVLYSIYEELLTAGTAAAMIVEDFDTCIRAHNYTIGEFYLGAGPDGRVNSFARRFKMQIGALVKEYGLESVSDSVKDKYKSGNVDDWVTVRWLVEPNDDRIEDLRDFENMEFRSVHWEEGERDGKILRKSGFTSLPFVCPRWDTTTTSDIYGKGPGWDALGDTKMLQKLQKDKLHLLDLLKKPPVQKNSNAGTPNLLPGGVTEYSSNAPDAGVKPVFQVNPDIQSLELSIEKAQMQIGKIFYTDLFLMMLQSDRRQITAREVAEKHEEKLLMLGPVLESLESELLDPLIDRVFTIMVNLGMIPEPPIEIQGTDIKPEYVSILAQAQKMASTTAIEQVLQFVGSIAAVSPDATDNVDFDEAIRRYAAEIGLPPKIIRSPEGVAALRKLKRDAIAKQEQVQSMAGAAAGAKTLSEARLGQNSALDVLMNGMAGNGTPGTGIVR